MPIVVLWTDYYINFMVQIREHKMWQTREKFVRFRKLTKGGVISMTDPKCIHTTEGQCDHIFFLFWKMFFWNLLLFSVFKYIWFLSWTIFWVSVTISLCKIFFLIFIKKQKKIPRNKIINNPKLHNYLFIYIQLPSKKNLSTPQTSDLNQSKQKWSVWIRNFLQHDTIRVGNIKNWRKKKTEGKNLTLILLSLTCCPHLIRLGKLIIKKKKKICCCQKTKQQYNFMREFLLQMRDLNKTRNVQIFINIHTRREREESLHRSPQEKLKNYWIACTTQQLCV